MYTQRLDFTVYLLCLIIAARKKNQTLENVCFCVFSYSDISETMFCKYQHLFLINEKTSSVYGIIKNGGCNCYLWGSYENHEIKHVSYYYYYLLFIIICNPVSFLLPFLGAKHFLGILDNGVYFGIHYIRHFVHFFNTL